MAWIPDPSNPGWLRNDQADAAREDSWWKIPDGFVADPNSPGWWFDPNGDPAAKESWAHDPSVSDEVEVSAATVYAPTTLVQAIDVASYQPTDLSGYVAQFGVKHVIVKAYQSIEGPQNQAHAKAQIQSAIANGCSVGAYCWLYASVDPARQVADSLGLMAGQGITLPLLWLDIEKYTDGSMPNPGQIRAALDACEANGVRGGIYSGKYIWQELGNPSLPGVPLWSANYDGNPTLNTPTYGDMELVAHQFTSTPLDRSVILATAAGLA